MRHRPRSSLLGPTEARPLRPSSAVATNKTLLEIDRVARVALEPMDPSRVPKLPCVSAGVAWSCQVRPGKIDAREDEGEDARENDARDEEEMSENETWKSHGSHTEEAAPAKVASNRSARRGLTSASSLRHPPMSDVPETLHATTHKHSERCTVSIYLQSLNPSTRGLTIAAASSLPPTHYQIPSTVPSPS